jgi:hypothetical protein
VNDDRIAGTDAGPTNVRAGTDAPAAALAPREGGATEAPEGQPFRDRTGTYAAVLATEALVVAALWWFSRHFSA